jgi:hypothetical protein
MASNATANCFGSNNKSSLLMDLNVPCWVVDPQRVDYEPLQSNAWTKLSVLGCVCGRGQTRHSESNGDNFDKALDPYVAYPDQEVGKIRRRPLRRIRMCSLSSSPPFHQPPDTRYIDRRGRFFHRKIHPTVRAATTIPSNPGGYMQALIAIELITGVIVVIVFGVSELAQELARRPYRPSLDGDDDVQTHRAAEKPASREVR